MSWHKPLSALALFLCLAAAALAGPDLVCTADLSTSSGPLPDSIPTDVDVAPDGTLAVLYAREGRVGLLRSDGTLRAHYGLPASEQAPPRFEPISLWVGPWAEPTLLACEAGKRQPEWRLTVRQGFLRAQRLEGAELAPSAVAAVGPEGRFYALSGQTLHAFGPSGARQYRVSLGGLTAPRSMALDRQRNVYVLHAPGLAVFSPKGSPRFQIDGAQAFDLAADDRLLAVGLDRIRKYASDGRLLVERTWQTSGRQVVAASLTPSGEVFVYQRDPHSGAGRVLRLSTQLEELEEFLQPARFPPGQDPGMRLDSRGRLHLWDASQAVLQKYHPGGRLEASSGYAPQSAPKGRLLRPADLAWDKDGLLWVADTGNCRLQCLDPQRGWLEPVSVGIRDGGLRGEPRQVAVDGRGAILCVVHPPSGQGQVVLQRRDRRGRLLWQGDLGEASGNPIIKLALGQDGSIFLYRSDSRLTVPVLTRLDSRGKTLARVGGEDRNFHLPGQFASRISLKPEEDMIAYKGGVILPVGGRLAFVNNQLEVHDVRAIRHARGATLHTLPDFGGGAVSQGQILYLTDLANGVIHRIPLEAR
jgi:hypothetical protein